MLEAVAVAALLQASRGLHSASGAHRQATPKRATTSSVTRNSVVSSKRCCGKKVWRMKMHTPLASSGALLVG
jgi:hypothetical protein